MRTLSAILVPITASRTSNLLRAIATLLRAECDFSEAVRGKHHEAYREGMNVILLDSDLACVFPDSASVNRALGLLGDLASKEAGREKRSSSTE